MAFSASLCMGNHLVISVEVPVDVSANIIPAEFFFHPSNKPVPPIKIRNRHNEMPVILCIFLKFRRTLACFCLDCKFSKWNNFKIILNDKDRIYLKRSLSMISFFKISLPL